jgi:hypothetical protein
MAGFPEAGKVDEIGHECSMPAAPDSLSSYVLAQQGPGPQKARRQIFCLLPKQSEDLNDSVTRLVRELKIKRRLG